jgi:hypothetical protein
MIETLSEDELWELQKDTFSYFVRYQNPDKGLIADSTKKDSACSIAAVGLALTAYVVASERGWTNRQEASSYVHKTLEFFWNAEQSRNKNATGYKGFFYHFVDMSSGERALKSEISTIDSTYIFAGALTAAAYFDRENETERKIRRLAKEIYFRADWHWAQNKGITVSHGWRPERGFIRYRWEGYNEALMLYILGLASPTFPLPVSSYSKWCRSYEWKKIYDMEFLFASPMFIHQLSHIWIDFRGIRDDYMRSKAIDYFENSRRAAYVQQQYAIRNPKGFRGYGEYCWGISASDGPGPATLRVDGIRRRFYDYKARGIPWGPDDGTLAPWALVGSLPFAPEIVLPTLRYLNTKFPEMTGQYGYKCSFNPTFVDHKNKKKGWISVGHYGLDQGPVVLAIENYRSGLIWRLTRNSAYFVNGLQRAGFRGSWLDSK